MFTISFNYLEKLTCVISSTARLTSPLACSATRPRWTFNFYFIELQTTDNKKLFCSIQLVNYLSFSFYSVSSYFYNLINTFWRFFKQISYQKIGISRVHLHPLLVQSICSVKLLNSATNKSFQLKVFEFPQFQNEAHLLVIQDLGVEGISLHTPGKRNSSHWQDFLRKFNKIILCID